MRSARGKLAIETRLRGPEHPRTIAARLALARAKIDAARGEVARLRAELAAMERAS